MLPPGVALDLAIQTYKKDPEINLGWDSSLSKWR